MPELPEVETVRRTLLPLIKDKTIASVTVWYPQMIANDVKQFCRQLAGAKLLTIDRYGKYLMFRFSNQLTLVSHLRMSGRYYVCLKTFSKSKHDHVQFLFTDQTILRYEDVRKFGRMKLVSTGTAFLATGLAHLGPEPNSAGFTLPGFAVSLKHHTKNIKAVLLDQSAVCGLGNIYVDEALWDSGIQPISVSAKLPKAKVADLYDSINRIISKAIEAHGSTIRTYLDANGNTGHFQNVLRVYGRVGQACVRCGKPLTKIKLQGRGTTFCLHCQEVYQ